MRLRQLHREEAGSAIIEFGMLAPILIVMMVGVLQVGLAVQNYSAVRNVASDVARHAMVQYTIGQPMTNQVLRTYTLARAEGAPYLLQSSRLNARVANVTSPQVAGTIEKTLTITYQIPSLLDEMGLNGPSITYSRPLIVTAS